MSRHEPRPFRTTSIINPPLLFGCDRKAMKLSPSGYAAGRARGRFRPADEAWPFWRVSDAAAAGSSALTAQRQIPDELQDRGVEGGGLLQERQVSGARDH